MLVKNWMSKEVITVNMDESMQDAIYLMQEKAIKLLPVVSKNRLVGIVSDRDLKKASPSDATTLDMHEMLYLISRIKIKDLMIREVITVPPDHTLEEAAAVLLEKRISGVPVVDSADNLVGVITQSDIFRALISITGLGRKGIQVAIRVPDKPGPIKQGRELIREQEGRCASILSSAENAPLGHLNVYFRIYDIPRENVSALIDRMKKIGTLLYIVDHRENRRTLYEDKE